MIAKKIEMLLRGGKKVDSPRLEAIKSQALENCSGATAGFYGVQLQEGETIPDQPKWNPGKRACVLMRGKNGKLYWELIPHSKAAEILFPSMFKKNPPHCNPFR